jgi:HlyD family secretion protein
MLAAAVVAIVALSLRPRHAPPVHVQLAPAREGPITRTVTAAGKLQAATTVKLSSNLSGDLLELAVDEGDRVTKGQLVGRIEARRYAAQVRAQEANEASARAELAGVRVVAGRLRADLERLRRLADGGNASVAEVERGEADLRAEEARAHGAEERIAQAAAALAEARHLLSQSTLVAPIDGVVVQRHKQVGERVRGSDFNEDPIVTIATLSAMEVKVEVGEHEVVHLREGNAAEVEVDAFPERKFRASVVEVAKNANVKNAGTEQELTTFPVRLALVEPVPGALPGMSAQATVSTETRERAIVVPLQAVTVRSERELRGDGAPPADAAAAARPARREGLRKVVFVVEGGVARSRPVETGLASERDIEVVSGLAAGEQVVEGPYKALSRELKDGQRVTDAPPEATR